MIYTISNGIIQLSVNSFGGSMTSIKYLGEERQWQGGEFWQGQDVVIFPIIGHAGAYEVEGKTFTPKSHGVARYSEFTLVENSGQKITLSINSNEETLKTYPYEFYFEISYELNGNGITVTYTVKSKSGKIPFYVGGHPAMQAPLGSAVISFDIDEKPVLYPLGSGEGVQMGALRQFVANKDFFKEYKTFQLGGLSGTIHADTCDGYRYTYKSDCPVWAFWSNEKGGEYICVEPWWGINDCDGAPKELIKKPFINFADENGKKFSYKLFIEKI